MNFSLERQKWESKAALYRDVLAQLKAITEGEPHPMPNLCNAAAILWLALEDINWAGFYLLTEGQLVLGPFQGKPACIRIPIGRGVCGTAAAKHMTQLVENVHEFPGHIACDSASNSEIVVPILKGNRLLGVIDIDSPSFGRFDEEDQVGLEAFAEVLAGLLPEPK